MNRANDFPPEDEVERKLKVSSNGRVRYTRMLRMRSLMGTYIQNYPFDIQFAELIISSTDYSDTKIRIRFVKYYSLTFETDFLLDRFPSRQF